MTGGPPPARDPKDLRAGYVHIRRGTAAYRGALRWKPDIAPVWSCVHDHLTAMSAKACAETEKARRVAGRREVFTLLHCERCGEHGGTAWWDDVPGGEQLSCPRCGVPLERLKLAVVGREAAVDEGKRPR